ncbi:lipoprotein [Streptomyces eurocidicus]|uniref:Lipoprotein n=1 Tax=Streptomyces eurocidicus TaxID=66423 RepID=A0A2N8P333_STREU|nr:esterase-like activity of phytase family protein [Streptomyces eurocidicus]MBB5117633.1 hypothetical protein [Streptomyces eurocidicus]MBF6053470.1 esterase-like activity of phytase family protein [Streptomyces eurocidicus]PNE35450.1 lipoprotein [Streptomyces eurocidicus]
MRIRPALTTVIVAALSAAVPAGVPAAAGTPSRACSPYVRIDGYGDGLDKTAFEGAFVGNLSALAADTDGTVAALSDRSRLFALDVRRGPTAARPVRVRALADEKGGELDSEALAVDRDGTRLVASETEPSVRRYARDGTLLGRLPVPGALRPAPAGRALPNQTFEGLTLRDHGRTLLAAMEGPLAGDTRTVRFQSWWRPRTGPGAPEFRLGPQYGYPLDPGLGVSEAAAADDGRLLVLERGYTPGAGNTVRLYAADTRGASDVSGVETLPGGPGTRQVRKRLLADLGECPSLGAPAKQPQTNPLLDNIEGMAVLGRAPGGRLRLLLVSDDNESARQTTRLYALTVRPR